MTSISTVEAGRMRLRAFVLAAHSKEGAVLGTGSYMSPEQAEGKPLDPRSDIFSFGAVLYEMTTGQQAFRLETAMSTISAILRDEPTPPSQFSAAIPRGVGEDDRSLPAQAPRTAVPIDGGRARGAVGIEGKVGIAAGNVVYLKETVTTSYQGGHAGLSVRVAKGVYYHVGGFNGRRIQTASLKRADQGAMLLTTQNLYFGGAHTNFRIPYERVLSCRSYTDGIGLFRDSANAKPEVFSVIEAGNAVNAHPITGWLLFNLVKFLAQPEGRALYTAKRQKQAHPARAINQ